jgi:hypothetical protein
MKSQNARPGLKRFPLSLQLRYKAVSRDMALFGVGRTNLMSSTELIFTSEQSIEPGMTAEISIAWPVLLDNSVRLQLILEGAIVRSEGRIAQVRIAKYYYKTRGAWADVETAKTARSQPRVAALGSAAAPNPLAGHGPAPLPATRALSAGA